MGRNRPTNSHDGNSRRDTITATIDFIGGLVYQGASILLSSLKVGDVVCAVRLVSIDASDNTPARRAIACSTKMGSFRPAASQTLEECKRDREVPQGDGDLQDCHDPALEGGLPLPRLFRQAEECRADRRAGLTPLAGNRSACGDLGLTVLACALRQATADREARMHVGGWLAQPDREDLDE